MKYEIIPLQHLKNNEIQKYKQSKETKAVGVVKYPKFAIDLYRGFFNENKNIKKQTREEKTSLVCGPQ